MKNFLTGMILFVLILGITHVAIGMMPENEKKLYQYISSKNAAELKKLLIPGHGFDLNTEKIQGWLASLAFAEDSEKRETNNPILELLLDAGTHPTDEALDAALQAVNYGAVKALVAHGANVDARCYPNKPSLQLLEEQSLYVYTQQDLASPEDADKLLNNIADILIDAGADLSAPSEDGGTLDETLKNSIFFKTFKDAKIIQDNLLNSIKNNNSVELEKILTDNPKLKINKSYSMLDSTTPLHYAAKIGYLAIVQTLLKHGAKIDIKDKNGKTPSDLATSTDIKNLLTPSPLQVKLSELKTKLITLQAALTTLKVKLDQLKKLV